MKKKREKRYVPCLSCRKKERRSLLRDEESRRRSISQYREKSDVSLERKKKRKERKKERKKCP